MLHDLLRRYLEEVETAVRGLEDTYAERYHEEVLTSSRVNLRIRIRFPDGSLLELNEALIVETGAIDHLGYRYHFQDRESSLLFRYDNTPHFPGLHNFPHHKHTRTEVAPCEKPSIPQVVDEVRQHFLG